MTRTATQNSKVKTKTRKIAQLNTESSVQEELIELFVFGLTLGTEGKRPLLIFKDASGNVVLPVWVNPVDATFAMNNHAHQAYAAHSIVFRVMESFGVKLERCVFESVKGHQQYVRLHFTGNEKLTSLEARADDAMSVCLASGARFYAPSSFVTRSREIDAELLGIEAGIQQQPEIAFRNHKYVM